MATRRTRHNLIKKIYTDPSNPASFGGKKALLEGVRKVDSGITLGDVSKVLATLDSYALHKQRNNVFPTRRHISPGINHYFQMDLFVMNENLARINGWRYILFMIDIFSKKLFLRPLKTKRGAEVARAIHSIIKENKTPPLKISSDRGGEFINADVKKLMESYNIIHFYSNNVWHSAVVERAIGNMKNRIGRYMTHYKTKIFMPKLKDFLHAYNSSSHKSLPGRLSPNQVSKNNEFLVWKHQNAKLLRRAPGYYKSPPKLKLGQFVKITRFPTTFRKGSEQTFTGENFVITQVIDSVPTTYKIADLVKAEELIGTFYRQELQPILFST